MTHHPETWTFNPSWDHSQQSHGEYDYSSHSTDLPSHQFNNSDLSAGTPHGATGYPPSLSSQQFMPNQQSLSNEHYPSYPSQGGDSHVSQVFAVQPPSQSGYFPQPSHHDASQQVQHPSHASTVNARAGTLHVSPPTSSTFEVSQSFVSSPDSLPRTSPPSSSNRNFSFATSAPEGDRDRGGAQKTRRPSRSPGRRGNVTDNAASHLSKRPRASPESDDEANAQAEEAPQLKRACARCKGLKVRCEFRDDQETCERCLKGPHECSIPGKKIRRPPPKRADLLSQIQNQASQIAQLMGQLEQVQRGGRKPPTASQSVPSPGSRTQATSPVDSTNASTSARSMTSPSASAAYQLSTQGPEVTRQNSEWIAEARKKLEAFGGFIGMGGGSMRRDVFVHSDPEDSSSEDDGEYDIAVNVRDDDDNTNRPMSSIPTEASPFGLMAKLSIKNTKGRRASSVISSDHGDVGVANEDFFRPMPGPDLMGLSLHDHEPPALLKKGIITIAEAEKLFNIYFDWMNISLSLLDPVLYTAQQVYWRSPFLFTVICAIASRYYDERPDLYPTAIEYANQEAGANFIGGQKRVEVVQAYILLSLYPVPGRRWDEDRCWIYLGQAIRMALDMNLHHPNTAKPRSEAHAREMLNRTRAWLNCVNLDRSMGSQYGKAAVIRNTDYVAVQSGTWWNSSKYNMEYFDIHISAYNAELRMVTDFLAQVFSDPRHPAGLNKDIDLEQLATETDDRLENLRHQWFSIFERSDLNNVQNRFRIGLLKLAYSYARLVALSYGFQHAFGKSDAEDNPFLTRCIRAASDVIGAMVDDVGIPSQRIYIRHGPMAQIVFVTFAATFLIKLLQPKYARHIGPSLRESIISQVQRTADFLGSPEVAIDERHGPKLYSRFIGGLLANVKEQRASSTSPKHLSHRKSMRKLKTSPRTSEHDRSQLAPAPLSNQPSPHSNTQNFCSMPPQHQSVPQSLPQSHSQSSANPYANVGMGTTTFDPYTMDMNQYQNMNSLAMGQDHGGGHGSAYDSSSLGTQMEFYRQPLPFETEFLQSMQSSLTELDATIMPGYAWMEQMPSLEQQQQHASRMSSGIQY